MAAPSSDADRGQRLAAATGIGFVVLIVVATFFGSPPDFGAPADEVSRYYREDQRAIQSSALVFATALALLLSFLGTLRSVLAEAERDGAALATIGFGGGLVAVALLIISLSFVVGAAFRPEETPPELTRTLDDLSFLVLAPGACSLVVFFAATGAAILRTDALPRWLGSLAALVAVLQALGAGAVFEDSGLFAADGVFGYAAFFSFLAWILAASVVMAAGKRGLRRWES
ncbi:MAG TPA: hypothetical protein VG144_11015 [Gaiellaceae bacterium]|nr:hypothetical protein [Gaiellaceae bacterium]